MKSILSQSILSLITLQIKTAMVSGPRQIIKASLMKITLKSSVNGEIADSTFKFLHILCLFQAIPYNCNIKSKKIHSIKSGIKIYISYYLFLFNLIFKSVFLTVQYLIQSQEESKDQEILHIVWTISLYSLTGFYCCSLWKQNEIEHFINSLFYHVNATQRKYI